MAAVAGAWAVVPTLLFWGGGTAALDRGGEGTCSMTALWADALLLPPTPSPLRWEEEEEGCFG